MIKSYYKVISIVIALLCIQVSSVPACYAQVRRIDTIDVSETVKRLTPEKKLDLSLLTGGSFFETKNLQFKFDTQEVFDDNIYLSKDNRSCDYITHLKPSFSGYIGGVKHMLSGKYDADIAIHALQTENQRLSQRIETRLELFKENPFRIDIKNVMSPRTDVALSENDTVIKKLIDVLSASIKYDLSRKSTVELAYRQSLNHYFTEAYELSSNTTYTASPAFYWHYSPKTSFKAEYGFGMTEYSKNESRDDSMFHSLLFGVEGRITPKSTMYAKAGYQIKFFDDFWTEPLHGIIFQGIYNYQWTEKAQIELMAQRGLNESIILGGGNFSNTTLYTAIKYQALLNLKLTLAGFYSMHKYVRPGVIENKEEKNTGTTYGVKTNIDYRFQDWGSSYLAYEFKRSNFKNSVDDYINNRVLLGVKLEY